MKKYIVEFIGIFWLVFGGCGSVVFVVFIVVFGGGNINEFGLGYLGVVLVFGLMVFIGVYVFGYIFGGYFNFVVFFGFWMGKRFFGF